jgi:hypothetical protein
MCRFALHIFSSVSVAGRLLTRAFGALVPLAQDVPLTVVGLAIKFAFMRRTACGCFFISALVFLGVPFAR